MAHYPVILAEFHLLGHEPSCIPAISINVPFGPVAEAVSPIEYSSGSCRFPASTGNPGEEHHFLCKAGDPHKGGIVFPGDGLRGGWELAMVWLVQEGRKSCQQSRPRVGGGTLALCGFMRLWLWLLKGVKDCLLPMFCRHWETSTKRIIQPQVGLLLLL